MDWQKHEAVGRWVKIGDGVKDVKEIQGVLMRIERNRKYPHNLDYILHDGDGLVAVRENAMMISALDFADYGKPVKISFGGWGKAKSGNAMKVIEVFKLDGPYDAKVKAMFPKAGSVQPIPGTKESMRAPAPTEDDAMEGKSAEGVEDDDLPF